MNFKQKFKRLTSEEKEYLIERHLGGDSITKICSEAGISRTIFYKWLSARRFSEANSIVNRQKKPKKHWRKQKLRKEQEILKLWINNPDLTIRQIAEQSIVSVGGVFNIIKRYKKQGQNKGIVIRRYKKKIYKFYTPEEKKVMIQKYYNHESVAKICRESGISRTIFYKWLKMYNHEDDNYDVLRRNIPRGQRHWRFMPIVREKVLNIIFENPQISLSKLAIAIKEEGEMISRSGLYYILQSMNLATYEKRLAYFKSLPIQESGLSIYNSRYFIAQSADFIPRFIIFTVFCTLISFFLLSSLSKSVKLTGELVRDITPTIINVAERTGKEIDKKSKAIFEPVRSDQDLTGGAFSANIPKDTLRPGEKSDIGFGVVDAKGNTICEAIIILDLSGFNEKERIAIKNDTCSLQGTSNNPDYVVSAPTIIEQGEYNFDINAHTYEGERAYERNIVVTEGQPFEIVRKSYPSRIFPKASYPIEVEIRAKRDFNGVITERLPDGILASNISDRGVFYRIIDSQDKVIKWKVNLRKDEVYKISYSMHFPQVWPEFYEIGPIELTDRLTGKVIYREARYWQIVSDAM